MAKLHVTIDSGRDKGLYNVIASSTNGQLSYQDIVNFSKPLGIEPRDPRVIQEKDKNRPNNLGIYQSCGCQIGVEYCGNLRLVGVPAQHLGRLCLQPDVKELELGRYNDAAGRYKMRKQAQQNGIKVKD